MINKLKINGSFKNISDIELEISDNVTLISGMEFSGKTAILESIPFVFYYDDSFSSQSSTLHIGGVQLLESFSMSKSGVIDIGIELDGVYFNNEFSYVGGSYGVWKMKGESPFNADDLKKYRMKTKVFGFKDSKRTSFSKPAPTYLRSNGEGLFHYMQFIGSNDIERLEFIFNELKMLFPVISEISIPLADKSLGRIVNKCFWGDGTLKSEFSSDQMVFVLNNGAEMYLYQMPMSIQTALATMVLVSSPNGSDLVLIDDFDMYVSDNVSKMFLESIVGMSKKFDRQVFLSTNKNIFITEDAFDGLTIMHLD